MNIRILLENTFKKSLDLLSADDIIFNNISLVN